MLVIEGKALQKAVGTALLGVATGRRRSALPILECVRIDAADGMLQASGYNLDEYVRASMPAGTNGNGIHAAVPGKEFLAVLKGFGPTAAVGITDNGASLEITSGPFKHRIEVIPDELPALPIPVRAEWSADVDGRAFAEALAAVIPGASPDEARPVLQTVLLEAKAGPQSEGTIVFTACDGFRLQQRAIPAELPSNHRAIVPLSAAKALVKMIKAQGYGDVRLWIDGENVPDRHLEPEQEAALRQKIMVECGGASLVVRCGDWRYPDYKVIIPVEKSIKVRVTVNRLALLAAVDRVAKSILKDHAVRLHFRPAEDGAGWVKVSVAGMGKDEADLYDAEIHTAKHEGSDLLMGFNPGFLADALRSAPEANGLGIEIKGKDGNTPAILQPAGEVDGWYLAVVMPMYLG